MEIIRRHQQVTSELPHNVTKYPYLSSFFLDPSYDELEAKFIQHLVKSRSSTDTEYLANLYTLILNTVMSKISNFILVEAKNSANYLIPYDRRIGSITPHSDIKDLGFKYKTKHSFNVEYFHNIHSTLVSDSTYSIATLNKIYTYANALLEYISINNYSSDIVKFLESKVALSNPYPVKKYFKLTVKYTDEFYELPEETADTLKYEVYSIMYNIASDNAYKTEEELEKDIRTRFNTSYYRFHLEAL